MVLHTHVTYKYINIYIYTYTVHTHTLSVLQHHRGKKGEIDWQRARNGVCSEHLVVL